MPAYIYNVLTPAGAALIAQATAANPIVWVGALSKATAATSAEDLAAKDAAWYDGKAGEIVAVSATDNVARPVAAWRPSGARQAALSLCVTARLSSQTDADAVVMSAMSDPDSTVVLPGADDTGQTVGMPFPIDINAADSVAVTPGAAASVADLARFVSLHKAGDPTAGDVQTIRGEKTFKSAVVCDDDLLTFDIYSKVSSNYPLIGKSDNPYGHIYVETVHTESIVGLAGGDIAIGLGTSIGCNPGVWLGTVPGPATNVRTKKVSVVSPSDNTIALELMCYEDADEVGYFSFGAGLVPSAGDTYDLGASGRCWDHAYVNCLYLPNIDLYYGNDTDALTINNDFTPEEDEGYKLGSRDYKWSNVWAKFLHGVIPHPQSSSEEPPIGCILWIAVYSTTTPFSIGFGELVHGHVGSNRRIYVAEWDASSNEFFSYGSELNIGFEFRALCRATPNSNNYCFLLAIRTK